MIFVVMRDRIPVAVCRTKKRAVDIAKRHQEWCDREGQSAWVYSVLEVLGTRRIR